MATGTQWACGHITASGLTACPICEKIDALQGWKASALAVMSAADERLRPLVQDVPGALGRDVYEVAAEEIVRLRGIVEDCARLIEDEAPVTAARLRRGEGPYPPVVG